MEWPRTRGRTRKKKKRAIEKTRLMSLTMDFLLTLKSAPSCALLHIADERLNRQAGYWWPNAPLESVAEHVTLPRQDAGVAPFVTLSQDFERRDELYPWRPVAGCSVLKPLPRSRRARFGVPIVRRGKMSGLA